MKGMWITINPTTADNKMSDEFHRVVDCHAKHSTKLCDSKWLEVHTIPAPGLYDACVIYIG